MELLDVKDYGIVTGHLKQVRINHLFALSVSERKVSGKVFVDRLKDPKTFYVMHPYGMSLLFGDSQNAEFNDRFLDHSLNANKDRDNHVWMQAFPNDWDEVLAGLYGDRMIRSADNKENVTGGVIELNTRINFKFSREKFSLIKRKPLPEHCRILHTDKRIFGEMTGSVIPSRFWDNASDFIKNSVGFSLFCDNKLATTAYAAFIHDDKLELGIETIEDFRGKGFAHMACSALIDHCLESGYEPVWACRLENTGSYRLAEKLGFAEHMRIPYYRLSN